MAGNPKKGRRACAKVWASTGSTIRAAESTDIRIDAGALLVAVDGANIITHLWAHVARNGGKLDGMHKAPQVTPGAKAETPATLRHVTAQLWRHREFV